MTQAIPHTAIKCLIPASSISFGILSRLPLKSSLRATILSSAVPRIASVVTIKIPLIIKLAISKVAHLIFSLFVQCGALAIIVTVRTEMKTVGLFQYLDSLTFHIRLPNGFAEDNTRR